MATVGPNDRNHTEEEPFRWFASTGDVESWGRVHKAIWDAVNNVTASLGAPDWPSYGEARSWLETSQRYSDLSDVGVADIWEFGGMGTGNMDQIVGETIASAKEGKRLLGQLRDQGEIPGGDDAGGSGDDRPTEAGKDFRLFMSGAAVLGLGYLAWANWPRE